MEHVQKIGGYKTADGKLHETVESARLSVLETLIDKALAGAEFGDDDSRDEARKFFLDNFDPIRLELDRIMNGVR
jgi:hypothetical protein